MVHVDEDLERVRAHYNGKSQQRAGTVAQDVTLGDHLQIHNVFSGSRQRLGHDQHGAHVTGTLKQTVKVKLKYLASGFNINPESYNLTLK